MFNQLFATMNDVLDDILKEYPEAKGAKKQELEQQIGVLKAMSDSCIEQWLLFEERLEQAAHAAGLPLAWPGISPPASAGPPPKQSPLAALPAYAANPPLSDAFRRGQGFYQLMMYEEAIREFARAVEVQPDFLLARLYLALGFLRKGDFAEAYRHFQLLTSLTDHHKMKAISYNAMGCIQAKNKNVEKAQHYFQLAVKADPSFTEPWVNMNLTLQEEEKLLSDSGLIL